MTCIVKMGKDFDILAQLGGINEPYDCWLSLFHPGPYEFYFRDYLRLEYRPDNHRSNLAYFVQSYLSKWYKIGEYC